MITAVVILGIIKGVVSILVITGALVIISKSSSWS